MLTPFLLLLLSLLSALALRPLPGETAIPLFLLAVVASLAALILLLRAMIGRRRKVGHDRRQDWVVIDGSNVMFWQDDVPRLAAVTAVLDEVKRAGLKPIVWFDANVGYKLADRHMGPRDLSRALGLPLRQIRIAPSGTPADPLLLEEAAALGTGVVTNDLYRDWVEAFPSVRVPGVLVSGRVTADGQALLKWAA